MKKGTNQGTHLEMKQNTKNTTGENCRVRSGFQRRKRLMAILLCLILMITALPATAFGATQTRADMEANVLHDLNLLAGSGAGFTLHKKLSRVEAITMVIHMMGADAEVLSGNYEHPFTDVPDWAQKYVGYAYEKGLSAGVGATLFGSSRDCTQAQYLTFILRVLGYNDSVGDFTWDQPFALARSIGLIDSETPVRRFSRGDMAGISFRALDAHLVSHHEETIVTPGAVEPTDSVEHPDAEGVVAKPETMPGVVDSLKNVPEQTTTKAAIVLTMRTLKDQLMEKGVFTREMYDAAMAVYGQGPKIMKSVYLTFDDGPSAKVTPQILDTLSKQGVPATFFVLGSEVNKQPAIVRRQYQEGHKIATHGYSHQYAQIYASPKALVADIEKGSAAIDRALGFEYNTDVFRFPGGSHQKSAKLKQAVTDAGYRFYDWTSSGEDATKVEGSTAKEIVDATIATIWGDTNNVIVLLHDTRAKKTTAEALPQIIQYFRDNGYEFRTL